MIALQCRAGVEARTRRFEGVAYSGGVIPGTFYGDVVIDLATTRAPVPMAILLEHDRSQRIGVGQSITLGSDMRVTGTLLGNEQGEAVTREALEGFPWQMSVHVEPGQVEEYLAGQEASVNGRSFTGPLAVFRNASIREISFTPTGMDANTWAKSVAAGGNPLLANARQRWHGEDPHRFNTNPLIADIKARYL